MVAKLNSKIDVENAMEVVKGWKHVSQRGPISIVPPTRDIVRTIYVCFIVGDDRPGAVVGEA